MEKYNSIVAKNSKVEMVQISLDRDKAAAEGWAVADKLPWYTVLPVDNKKGFEKFKSHQYVPEYALVSADGKRLATGPEVFDKVKELTK